MDDVRVVPRRTVEITLNEDLLGWAEMLTDDLNGLMVKLLTAYVVNSRIADAADPEEVRRTVKFIKELHERDGLLSDEFQSL